MKFNCTQIHPLLSVLVFMGLTYTACGPKQDDRPMNYFALPQDVKDMIAFKKGTYWIYADSIKGTIDSAYVDSFKLIVDTVRNNSSDLHGYYEGIHTYIVDAIDTSRTDYFVSMAYVSSSRDLVGLYDKVKKHRGDEGKGTFLIHPFTDTVSEFTSTISNGSFGSDGVHNVFYHLNGFINGNFYNNIVKVYHTFDQADHIDISYFYAAHTGLVRKQEGTRRRLWKLIRSHIKQ